MYDYDAFLADLNRLQDEKIQSFSIGKSVMEKELYCLKTGSGGKTLLLNGAHHGLEYLTSAFLMRFVEDFTQTAADRESLFGYDAKSLWEQITLYVIPMVNPDGVDIAIHGLDITNPYHRELISLAGIHSFTKVWQANAHGVDINHNYNAAWRMTVDRPAPTKYGGDQPENQPETKAIADFIRDIQCDMLLCFHSQGREIYYDFDGKAGTKAEQIARELAKVSGYSPCIAEGTASYGGCKDWFVSEIGPLGYTIEIGSGQNPLPMEMLDEIYEENAKLILCAMTELLR